MLFRSLNYLKKTNDKRLLFDDLQKKKGLTLVNFNLKIKIQRMLYGQITVNQLLSPQHRYI